MGVSTRAEWLLEARKTRPGGDAERAMLHLEVDEAGHAQADHKRMCAIAKTLGWDEARVARALVSAEGLGWLREVTWDGDGGVHALVSVP